MSEQPAGVTSYCSLRSLALWILAVCAVASFVLIDMPKGAVAGVDTADASAAWIWIIDLAERSRDDPFRVGMLCGFLAVLGYGLVQLPAMALDAKIIRDRGDAKPGGLRSAVRACLAMSSGRRLNFYDSRVDHTHLHEGMRIILLPLRHGTPLFPAVGFMGTVIGISIAIQTLPSVMGSDNLQPLLEGLYIAFDTTLLGLLALTVLSVLQLVIENSRLQIIDEQVRLDRAAAVASKRIET